MSVPSALEMLFWTPFTCGNLDPTDNHRLLRAGHIDSHFAANRQVQSKGPATVDGQIGLIRLAVYEQIVCGLQGPQWDLRLQLSRPANTGHGPIIQPQSCRRTMEANRRGTGQQIPPEPFDPILVVAESLTGRTIDLCNIDRSRMF